MTTAGAGESGFRADDGFEGVAGAGESGFRADDGFEGAAGTGESGFGAAVNFERAGEGRYLAENCGLLRFRMCARKEGTGRRA